MKINQTNVTIMVENMDNSITFYEMLGMKIKSRWGNLYAMMETTGLTLGIHPADKKSKGSGNVSIGLLIDHIDEAKVLLERNGISYKTSEDKGGVYLHFKDPDGTQIYFMQLNWK
jgi:predicted enzyme related to lactoylglutathione lyase